MPPHPPTFCMMPNVHTRARVQVLVSQTNGVLLPLGLVYGHVTWCLYFACIHVCVDSSLCFVFHTHVLVVCSLCGLLHCALSINKRAFLKATKRKKI